MRPVEEFDVVAGSQIGGALQVNVELVIKLLVVGALTGFDLPEKLVFYRQQLGEIVAQHMQQPVGKGMLQTQNSRYPQVQLALPDLPGRGLAVEGAAQHIVDRFGNPFGLEGIVQVEVLPIGVLAQVMLEQEVKVEIEYSAHGLVLVCRLVHKPMRVVWLSVSVFKQTIDFKPGIKGSIMKSIYFPVSSAIAFSAWLFWGFKARDFL
jgi:hypothetical protein